MSVEEWDRLSGNTKYIQEDYGCVFFLGECKKEIGNLIEDILKDKKIINVNDYCKNYSQAGPDEFINIIKNAEIVFTDSFHCAAFAIIYNKPFVVFERENWDKGQITRLKNMLELFGLKDRLFTGNKLNWFGMNYEHVNSIIESERKRINQYIDDVVGRKIGD